MNIEEQQLHLNNIIKGIEEVVELTRELDYHQFTQEEQVKEEVYSNLQMVGQAAYELSINSDNAGDLNFETDILSGFRNARYNDEMEVDHQMIWGIIENDLPIIRDEAIEASAQLGVPEETEASGLL
ncbi:HepT-like ribonuclease domain-containing protein [Fulvivirga ligni]|uniref:HepT-like ribonuclease domain-containing protein n=1 Tax=Fulvivirga ligni TaxID=2904246 RepID=UPI001F3D784E|nr:HepT-like ribonuclease domain-containing protein [Fulvivirga ligni]UII24140.1 hypothetical protein LVD16_13025 [Fulvivirga ligni]